MKKLILIFFLLTQIAFSQSELFFLMGDDGVDIGKILLDSLKAYYALSDSTDSYGTNNLTNTGVTFSAGKVGNCGVFSTTQGDFMSVANNANLSVSGDVSFTVSCWYYLTSAAGYEGIINKAGSGTTREFVILAYNQDATPDASTFYVSTNGSTTASTVSNNAIPLINTWYFLVAWHNSATDSIYIQINNGTISHSAFTTGIYAGTAAFVLGRNFGNAASNGMEGKLDEVAFWKRVLTPAERTYLYNNGSGRTYTGGKIQ